MRRSCSVSLCECQGVDAPIQNISCESPDPLLFWGQIWNPYNPYKPPPLGNGPYVKTDCDVFNEIFSIYDPIVYASTQLMANLQALAASLGCPWPTSGTEVFFNDAQTATVYCADGTAFSYTVEAGTLTSPAMDAELGAVWVIWANAWAEAYALQQASALLDCIVPTQTPDDPDNPDNPPIPPVPPQPPGPNPPTPPLGAGILTSGAWMCFGEEIVRTYVISGYGAGAYTMSIIAGSIPPGTTFVQTGPRRAVLSGTPTAPGVYNFTIQGIGTTPSVAVQATEYLFVFGISNANTLPDADAGVPYGPETLIGVGGTAPYTFASSNLPTGFSLSSGGVLTSDATTVDGDYAFDVVITDANGGECTQQCDVNVVAAPFCGATPSNIADLVWIITGTNGTTITASMAGGSGTLDCQFTQSSPLPPPFGTYDFDTHNILFDTTFCNPTAVPIPITFSFQYGSSGNVFPAWIPYATVFILVNGIPGVPSPNADLSTNTPNPLVATHVIPAMSIVTLRLGFFLTGIPNPFIRVNSVVPMTLT